VRTTGRKNIFEETMPGADGHLHHLRVTKAPWMDGQRRIIGTIGLAKDITEHTNQKVKFERFLDDLELGVIIEDNKGTVLHVNKVYLDIAGAAEEDIVGNKYDELGSRNMQKTAEYGADDYIVKLPNGKKRIWTRSKFELKDYWDNQYGYTYLFRDVTIERKKQKKIMKMAMMDQLTGLPNRAGMYKHINEMDKDSRATFLFIDIDNFKQVNDEYGHIVGDRLLKDVGALFRRVLADSFTARMGGDEFMSVGDENVDCSELKNMMDRLLESIKRLPDYPEKIRQTISFSVGILYRYPLNDKFDNIICKSDEGMYQAKHTGKNKYCFYGESP